MADILKKPNVSSGKPPINWNDETKQTLKKIGKVALKVLTYFFNIFLTFLLIVFIIGIIVGSTFAIYVKNYVDVDIDASLFIDAGANKTTQLFYTDSQTGEVAELEDQRIYGADNGIWVKYDDMPKQLVDAFIAIEDNRFESHNGVDWITTSKAFINYFLPFKGSFGGSTITQQLVKNLTGDNEAKITRKVQEIFRALNLEKNYSKDQIIEMYLNVIYFGNNCTGVQTAADTYFGKDVSELSLEECATLAGIVKNPYAFNPKRFPEKSMDRRDTVLWAMQDQGKISTAEAEALYGKPIVLADDGDGDSDETRADAVFNWYTEAVFNEVQNDLMETYGYSKYSAGMAIYTGGLKIYTCMDPEVQSVLEEVYTNDTEYFPMSSSSMQPESAMVIVDPYTGDVLGLVGGRGEKVSNRILNRATGTQRPPGSSIKPVSVYAPALDEGIITYASVYDDVPVNFGTDPEKPKAWPANLPYVYRGLTNVNSAIERSVNTVAVRVLQDLTPQASYDFITQKLGFSTVYDQITTASGAIMSDIDLSPLALGQLTYGISVREITAAYSIFQNDGVFNNSRLYTKVVDSNGNTILTCDKKTDIVISEQTASIMTKMLYNVVNDPEGTAVNNITLRRSVDVAGKTGTSTADFDRWFVGYTPYYVGGCWVGYDTNIALSAFGPNPACIVWDKVMTMLHQKYIDAAASGGEPLKTFDTAAGVIEAEYCKDSGKLVSEACRLDLRGDRTEKGWFAYGTEPSEYCDCHVKVKYCNDTNRVASPKCTNTRYVGLLRIEDRSFPTEITVNDAQYAYRDLPEGVNPGGWYTVPFFVNLLKEGEYCGTSNVSYPANAYCYEHGSR